MQTLYGGMKMALYLWGKNSFRVSAGNIGNYCGRVKGRVFGKQFPHFKNIPVYIEISEDDSFIYQYGNEKSEIIWKQIKNCCKQLADSIFY